MKLFDERPRTDASPSRRQESLFEFLNRVDTTYWARVRDLMEDWFTHLPFAERSDLRSRFRGSDRRHALAAFWELYLHELFRRLGYSISLHPLLAGTGNTPDFLMEKPGESFYVEATVVGEPEDERMSDLRLAPIYDYINSMQADNFLLDLEVIRESATTPPMRQLRRALGKWLRCLDPDRILPEGMEPSLQNLPIYDWEHSGWHLQFRPIPKKPEFRGRSGGRTIGIGPSHGGSVSDHIAVKSRLSLKADHYGHFDVTVHGVSNQAARGTARVGAGRREGLG